MADAASHEFNAADDATFLALAGSAARVGVAGYGLGFVLAAAGLLGLIQPPFHLPAHVAPVTLLAVAPGHYDLYLRTPEHAGFGVLRERNLTIEAAGAWLEARQWSNTDD